MPTELEKKLDEVLTSVVSVQEKCTQLEKDYGDKASETDSTVKANKKHLEDLTAEVQELKNQAEAAKNSTQYLEKLVSRVGKNSEADQKEMTQKDSQLINKYLKTKSGGFEIEKEIHEEQCKHLIEGFCKGVSDEVMQMQVKDLVSQSGPNSGYYLPVTLASKVITRIFETSPLRNLATVTPSGIEGLQFVIDDDEAQSGGWVGETPAERGARTDTPDLGELKIEMHHQEANPRTTDRALMNPGFDAEVWLRRKISDIFARTENRAFLIGNGSKKPTGILTLPAWTTAGTYQRFALEDINSGVAGGYNDVTLKKIQNSLKEAYQARAVWCIRRVNWTDITTLKQDGGNGDYFLDPRSMKNGDSLVLLGKPVIFMDDMPTAAADEYGLMYGDFNEGYTIIDGPGIKTIRDEISIKGKIQFYTTKFVGGAVTNFESIKRYKLSA